MKAELGNVSISEEQLLQKMEIICLEIITIEIVLRGPKLVTSL